MAPVHGSVVGHTRLPMFAGSEWDDLESVFCGRCGRWIDCPLDGAARTLALHLNTVHGLDDWRA
jgi:hypothetical protein